MWPLLSRGAWNCASLWWTVSRASHFRKVITPSSRQHRGLETSLSWGHGTFVGFTSSPLAYMYFSKASRVLDTSHSPDWMGLKDLTGCICNWHHSLQTLRVRPGAWSLATSVLQLKRIKHSILLAIKALWFSFMQWLWHSRPSICPLLFTHYRK